MIPDWQIILVGAIFNIISIYNIRKKRILKYGKESIITEGRIVGIDEEQISVDYYIGKDKFSRSIRQSIFKENYVIGQKVNIYYNPSIKDDILINGKMREIKSYYIIFIASVIQILTMIVKLIVTGSLGHTAFRNW